MKRKILLAPEKPSGVGVSTSGVKVEVGDERGAFVFSEVEL